MMRSFDYLDLITGSDAPLDDDSEVGPRSRRLGEPAGKLGVVHPDAKPPARNPWLGYLEDHRSDRPTLADERIVDRNSFCRQILSELAVLKRPPECFFPPA